MNFLSTQHLFFNLTKHVSKAIEDTPIITEPYTYLHVKNIFPTDFYNELYNRSNKIDTSMLKDLVELGNVEKTYSRERKVLMVRNYWNDSISGFEEFEQLKIDAEQKLFFYSIYWWLFYVYEPIITKKFNVKYQKKNDSLSLTYDHKGYSLGPHTDTPTKIITSLFYLPDNDQQEHLGTSLYKSIVPTPRNRKWSDYEKVDVCKYIPNSAMIFLRTSNSFHGVEVLNEDIKRKVLSYMIKGNFIV